MPFAFHIKFISKTNQTEPKKRNFLERNIVEMSILHISFIKFPHDSACIHTIVLPLLFQFYLLLFSCRQSFLPLCVSFEGKTFFFNIVFDICIRVCSTRLPFALTFSILASYSKRKKKKKENCCIAFCAKDKTKRRKSTMTTTTSFRCVRTWKLNCNRVSSIQQQLQSKKKKKRIAILARSLAYF